MESYGKQQLQDPFKPRVLFYDLPIPFGTSAHDVLTRPQTEMQPMKRQCEGENQYFRNGCSFFLFFLFSGTFAMAVLNDIDLGDIYFEFPQRWPNYTASAEVSVDTDMVTLAIFTVVFTQLSAALLAEMLACLFWQSDSRLLSSCWELVLQAPQELRKACRRSLLLRA